MILILIERFSIMKQILKLLVTLRKKGNRKQGGNWRKLFIKNIVEASMFSFSRPARMAQWWVSQTCDLVVVSSIPGWGNFFPAYFRLSPLQKHVRKVVGGFGKKSCISTSVRKPGNTYASPTAMIWP